MEHFNKLLSRSFVCFVALRPKSTAMVIAGRSVDLTTLFPGQAWTSSCVSVCPHETSHGRSYECITGIMYAKTHIHVPRNKLIVARFCILVNLIFTYLISWNKPVHEIVVPIAYANSEGSDEPAHPRKIASVLTAHIHNRRNIDEGACRGCEFKISKALEMTGHLRIRFIYHTSVCCYMRRSACAPDSLISTFVSKTNIKHFVGPDLGPNCLLY